MEHRSGFESRERACGVADPHLSIEPVRTLRPPIILVGMHRSGTSLLTAVLREFGLITGFSLNNEESAFFHRLNLYIERATGGRWDDPEPIVRAHADAHLLQHIVRHLKKEVTSPKIILYLGVRRFWRYRSLERVDQPWGWKDPRNTFTFDFWRQVFPHARVIHIYRHGVDVAASLRAREVNSRVQALSHYASTRCRTLSGAFGLWRAYVEKAFSLQPEDGERAIRHVRYEDFLASPEQTVRTLLDFCELPVRPDVLRRITARLKPMRAFAFRRDPELRAFYEEVRDDPWMIRLGYSD
ncbi:hypothetical protein HRbin10_01163 [bacterium HR10]|nr:hypothetical protein HRbin10_01163 [bacterium HR10]